MPHRHEPAATPLPEPTDLVIAADPCGRPNAPLAAAAARAGGTGLVDANSPTEFEAVGADLGRRLARTPSARVWVRPGAALDAAARTGDEAVRAGLAASGADTVVIAVTERTDSGALLDEALADALGAWREAGPSGSLRLVAQVTSREQALAAVEAGYDGLLASGREAGGRVGDTEAFVLLQQVLDLGLPVWLRGGIGLHTAAAVVAGGGTGVVLDTQLGLLREAGLPDATAAALRAMDGSETRIVAGTRFYTRPDLPAASLRSTGTLTVADRLGDDLYADLVPFGQDSGIAQSLAERFVTVGGLVQGIRASVTEHIAALAEDMPLAPGAGVSASHGTAYPIVQGPMTRVSDRAAFALAVAEGGGLPFLALALLPAHEVRALLVETAELLGDRPWGVGLLGFAPAELLAEQLAVVHEVKPPHALVAGGRPSQSASLEAAGISSYLHVPSPGLLDRFLADGARSFVFEGSECGGHVGPRSSFALWEPQIQRLMAVEDPENLRVLLAGGIHDGRSAAMVAAALAPLAAKGAQVGVLMGTAYLFTTEAVEAGAIEPAFQDMAVVADRTVLLETAPGHATRCVETDFVRTFAARKTELETAGVDAKERWAELEQLNLGRLRIASKGLERTDSGLERVATDRQLAEGMYMIGEVATLRDEVTNISDLHAEVSAGAAAWAKRLDRTDAVAREDADSFDIAIVGMESFLPGAVGAEQFWANVVAGTDHVTEVPADRWDTDLFHDATTYEQRGPGRGAGHTTPSKWGGFLDAVGFDPLAYGIPPASLAAIEPVQLLALEVAARALADAGYTDRAFDRTRASVVFGAESGNELGGMYGVRAFLPQIFGEVPEALEDWLPTLTEDSFPGVLANVIAGRIANRLDLGGVNYTVDAACGSSLAALDAACKELRTGTSDLVIAGGADLHNGLNDYLMFSSVHALSPTGRCRTFDADADGIALGEGIAAVVLKRRVDAERDGDRIYAIIDAVAGSSDGRHLGLTAPRKEGQQRAVARAVEASGVDLREVGLVEAHGTGTVVGDRTEMATLTELFSQAGVEAGSVVLGSVKSQIGHTKCTAGLAGIIKAAKALHHGVLPPTINLVDPNPYWEASTSPFRFHDTARPWPAQTRRAGVSAFGFGGTNFHAVVSSYDAGDRPAHGLVEWPCELFLVRGDDATASRTLTELAAVVDGVRASDPGAQRHALRDLARTVSSRGSGPVRAAFVAASFDEVSAQVSAALELGLAPATDPGDVAFLYPGQGSQRPGMLNDLFVTFGGLDDLLRLGAPWATAMFPPKAFTRDERAAQQAAITATDVAQPALGVAGLAMTRLLRRMGITPDVAGGHSYGELAALAAAGSFDEATLLSLSAARGRAVLDAVDSSGGDPGTMAAVSMTRDEVEQRLAEWPDVVVANHNAPRQVVVSGPTDSVRALVEKLEADGVRATLIPVACAFHSPLVRRANGLLAAVLESTPVATPAFPVWSNTTAEPYPADASSVRALLAAQVAEGVRFVDQIESMYAAGVRTFVETGPGRVLSGQVAKILGDRPHTVVATDVPGEHGLRRFLAALAELALAGVPVDASALFSDRADVVDLTAWPHPAPGWTVDGAFVRTRDGDVLPNSFQPAGTMPAIAAPVAGSAPVVHPQETSVTTEFDDLETSAPPAGAGAEAVVTEYLRSMRQVVAAERDVVLRYLGAAPAPAAAAAAAAPLAGGRHHDRSSSQPDVMTSRSAAPALSSTAPLGHTDGAPESSPRTTQQPAPTVDVLLAVQAIVSERTGYPVDMLEPDLDLEADLSIDSIKRIEIVGELATQIGLADNGDLTDDLVEELSRHKTLAAIVTWINTLTADPGRHHNRSSSPPHVMTSAPEPSEPHVADVDLMATVQAIVSERTGYPVDMLEPDLDLEADLSIDSIKRIEIVGELATQIGLADNGDLTDDLVEELSRHKTLAAIVTWINTLTADPGRHHNRSSSPPHVMTTAPEPSEEEDAAERSEVEALSTSTFGMVVEAIGPAVALGDLSGTTTALVDGHPALTVAVEAALAERGAQVARLAADDAVRDASLLAEVDTLVDLSTTSGDPRLDARSVFATLRPAVLGRATRVLAVGFAALGTDDPTTTAVPTGVPGMIRSLARERDDLLARSVELEPHDLTGDLAPLAMSLVDELLDLDAPASVSWAGGLRTTLVPGPVADVDRTVADLGLTPDSVVVLTGGARGITARIAEGIARQSPCQIILVGRSDFPDDTEDARLADARTPVELRRRLLEIGEVRTPAEVEAEVNRVIAAREITGTLEHLRELGAVAEYVSMDVRSPGFGALLDALHAGFGRLDGVIHGAGVLDDRLVVDKEPVGFDRVYGTKVDGARMVLDRQHLGIRFVALFGSVSGVFGNKGQVDYAAANDALDTLARAHDGRHGCRVVSLDWGPWAGGGMVSPELEREYARRGVGLLDPADGVQALLTEVAAADGPSQLVVMAGSPGAFAPVTRDRGRRTETAPRPPVAEGSHLP